MSAKGISIAFTMHLTALVALDLTLLRILPVILESPPLLYAFVVFNLVFVQALALARPLNAFHYAFIVVGLVSSVLTTLSAFNYTRREVGSLYILEALVKRYRAARGESQVVSPYFEFAWLGQAERFLTSLLGLSPAWVAGIIATRLIRRKNREKSRRGLEIATFLQGALIGLGVYAVGITFVFGLGIGGPASLSAGWYADRVAQALCPILGGIGALRWIQLKKRNETM